MALDACPECKAPLEGMTSTEIRAHRNDHWEGEIVGDSTHQAARERADQLDVEAARREIDEHRVRIQQADQGKKP